MSRICDFQDTTTGHPCGNPVEDGHDHCAAGHPCPIVESAPDSKHAITDVSALSLETEQLRTGLSVSPVGKSPGIKLNADGSPVAFPGEFCRVVIGSTIHGLNVPGTDNLDLMGVKIERIDEAMGLGQPFEQHVWRTQPEGVPSGPGDVDLTIYSLRKYLRLAANGNPTVLNLLFVGPESRPIDGPLAEQLRALTPKIVSRQAAWRYRGYLRAQRERLLGERGQKHTGYTRRLKYLAGAGWDTKFAMHMIRLGVQGVELLTTGRISLPMPDPMRSRVYDVQLGRVELTDVVAWAKALEDQLEHLADTSDLPPEPDRASIERWMAGTYLNLWNFDRVTGEGRRNLKYRRFVCEVVD